MKRGRDVYYELYIDVLFLVNFLMDYLLLLLARKVLRGGSSYGRLCLGALAGALLSCAVVALGIFPAAVKYLLFYGVIPAAMLFAAMPIRDVREFFRAALSLYIGGFLLGGIFTCLGQYAQVGSLFFALAMASYYLACGAFRALALLFRFGERSCAVTVYVGGEGFAAKAMIDTGNHLRDEVSGKAVSIISAGLAKRLFPGELPEGIRYIPYRTVGKGEGALPTLTVERICIGNGKEQWVKSPMLAISEEPSFGNEYDIILNPDI